MNKIILGYSELESHDSRTGIVSGAFRPGVGYELVQPIFRLHSEATMDRYRVAVAKLPLELTDPSGRLVPTLSIHIADRTVEKGPDALKIEIKFADQ